MVDEVSGWFLSFSLSSMSSIWLACAMLVAFLMGRTVFVLKKKKEEEKRRGEKVSL